MHKIVLTFVSLILFLSCQRTSKTEIVYSKDYSIKIETRGCIPGSSEFIAVLYNSPHYSLPNYQSYKPHHLYITSHPSEVDSTKYLTFDLTLRPEIEDSIFNCIRNYVMDFKIDNKEVLVLDGACLSVELEYNKKSIKCEQYNLEGISKASPQIATLLKIINKIVPEEFRMY
jgi:hypothetical protein